MRTNDTLAFGSAVKMMVTLGSETVMVVSAFVSFCSTTVLLMLAIVFGRGM